MRSAPLSVSWDVLLTSDSRDPRNGHRTEPGSRNFVREKWCEHAMPPGHCVIADCPHWDHGRAPVCRAAVRVGCPKGHRRRNAGTSARILPDGRLVCGVCGQAKDPMRDFHAHPNGPLGRQYRCKLCTKRRDTMRKVERREHA